MNSILSSVTMGVEQTDSHGHVTPTHQTVFCESISTMATYREKVRENLSCPVCYDTFDEGDRLPKGLPCYHTLCLACLDRYVKKNLEQNHLCPVCQAKFTVPNGGVKAILNNPGFMGMLELLEREDTESSEGATGTEVQAAKDQKVEMPKCPEHGNATCILYCMECYVPLCAKCMTINKKHHGHTLEDIASFTEVMQDDIEKNVNEFHQIVNDFEAFSEETLSTIFKQKSDVTAKIKQDVDRAAEQFYHKCERFYHKRKHDVDSHFKIVLKKFNDFTSEFNEKRCDFENNLKSDALRDAIPSANTNKMVTELKRNMKLIRSLKDKIPEMKSIPNFNTAFKIEECFERTHARVNKTTVETQTDDTEGCIMKESGGAIGGCREKTSVRDDQPKSVSKLSVMCAETMTDELTLTSVPITIPSGTVDLHLHITNWNAFVEAGLHGQISSDSWYARGALWKIIAHFQLPHHSDDRFPDKHKPVMRVDLRCENKKSYNTDMVTLVRNCRTGYWDNLDEGPAPFTPNSYHWGYDLFSMEWLMSAENPYVKDNTMHICVMLTVL